MDRKAGMLVKRKRECQIMDHKLIQELRLQREQLFVERKELDLHRRDLNLLINNLQLRLNRAEYPCTCVQLNSVLSIYDASEQEQANRRGLTPGLISETLSADRNCTHCHGSGIPTD